MNDGILTQFEYDLLQQYLTPAPQPKDKDLSAVFARLYEQKYILIYSHELVSFAPDTKGIIPTEWLITPEGSLALALFEENVAKEEKQKANIKKEQHKNFFAQLLNTICTNAATKVPTLIVDHWFQIKQFFHNLF